MTRQDNALFLRRDTQVFRGQGAQCLQFTYTQKAVETKCKSLVSVSKGYTKGPYIILVTFVEV